MQKKKLLSEAVTTVTAAQLAVEATKTVITQELVTLDIATTNFKKVVTDVFLNHISHDTFVKEKADSHCLLKDSDEPEEETALQMFVDTIYRGVFPQTETDRNLQVVYLASHASGLLSGGHFRKALKTLNEVLSVDVEFKELTDHCEFIVKRKVVP